ncbi:MAG: class I SAM-dependent methyltransferase [Candidatus Udaeobacter sp.]
MKAKIKQATPAALLAMYRKLWAAIHKRRVLRSLPSSARELYRLGVLTEYNVALPERDERIRATVQAAAAAIYGDSWNYYSDALRPEVAEGFVRTIDAVAQTNQPVQYLEIGSCQGLSMSLIASLLRDRSALGLLVSIDPYFETGYIEGEAGPYRKASQVAVTKNTKSCAMRLYAQLGLNVEIIERTSADGLIELIRNGCTFDLVYIDGSHEQLWPAIDFGLCRAVLRSNGVLILDDHIWPDVQPIKHLCDKHAAKIQETWKTASYRFL